MNLGKLLAAGKSVMGGRKEISYRISDRVYLPKFISPKNPFTPPAGASPPPEAAAAPVKNADTLDTAKAQKLTTSSPARPRGKTWASKFNPISIWRDSPPQTAQHNHCPMQAELSLDRVKVVHNDLSDADVEIVPMKSRQAPPTGEPVLTPAKGGDSWSRLSAKIFGVKVA